MKEPSQAMQVLNEEHGRLMHRRRLLERAKDMVCTADFGEAIDMVVLALESVTDSEERVLRVHAECVAMLEQAGRILALDASLRPSVIMLDAEAADQFTRKDSEKP